MKTVGQEERRPIRWLRSRSRRVAPEWGL